MSDFGTNPAVDPDVGPPGAEPGPLPWAVLAVIAAGGVIGALGRHGISVAFPHSPQTFGWATFVINVSGCLLIGALMVVITEIRRTHALVRPFLGVGVLGGFTTFSAYVLDIQRALEAGALRIGLIYLVATMLCALAATFAGIRLTRVLAGARRAAEAPSEEAG